MPDQQVDLFIKMVSQNKGKFSKAKREKFFSSLDDDQVGVMERLYAEYFG